MYAVLYDLGDGVVRSLVYDQLTVARIRASGLGHMLVALRRLDNGVWVDV